MSCPVGFVLLTHAQPAQIARLCWRLTVLFDAPPIVCHHDYSKSALEPRQLPPNVAMVHPHLSTRWADFTLVEATVRAFDLMYSGSRVPEWCVLLSGADYPIRPARRVLEDLNAGGYDAHVRHELVDAEAMGDGGRSHGRAPELGEHRIARQVCFGRYCTVTIPWLTSGLRPTTRVLYNPRVTRFFLPWSTSFRCYAGSQWFCANARAIEHIRTFHREQPKLANHYRRLMFPDESYFQTILANAPGLQLHNDNWRYTDWSAGGAHPKTLTAPDVTGVLASGRHFARKVDLDLHPSVLDMFDAAIDATV